MAPAPGSLFTRIIGRGMQIVHSPDCEAPVDTACAVTAAPAMGGMFMLKEVGNKNLIYIIYIDIFI